MAATLVVVLIASVCVAALTAPAAAQRERPPCSDLVGNVVEQVRDRQLQEIPRFSDIPNNPYEPESPGGVWDRCIEPFFPDPEPPTTVEDPLNGSGGSTFGDPHVITFDGLRYDFHGAGDFVLLETDDVVVQTRYTRSGPITFTHAVALRVEGTTLELSLRTPEMSVVLDGRELDVAGIGAQEFDGGYVLWTDDLRFVQLDNGVAIEGSPSGASVYAPQSQLLSGQGLLGDGDGDPSNDLVDGEGVVIDGSRADELYGAFFDAWYVEPADSLFAAAFDEQADGPLRPAQLVTLGDLDPDDVAAAAQVCMAGGLVAGEGLDECIFDVAVTGDPAWAQGRVAGAARLAVPIESLSTTVEDAIMLDELDSVSPDVPEAGAGRLSMPGAVDDYLVAASSVGRVVEVGPSCREFGGPTATVSNEEGLVGVVPLTCGRALALPATALQIRVSSAVGTPIDYSFDIRVGSSPGGDTNSGEVIGDVIVLDVTQPDVNASATLPLEAGQRVYVETLESIDSGRLRIFDPAGTPLASAFVFEDLGVLEADVAGDYQIVVEPSRATGRQELRVYEIPPDEVTDLVFGQDLELRISTPGQRSSLDVELEAGDRVYVETVERFVTIDGQEPSSGMLVAVGPDGSAIADSFAFDDLGLVTATVSGPHRISLVPEGPMVGFQVVRVVRTEPDREVRADVGDEIELEITTPGQTASALVDLAAGQTVVLETVEALDGRLTVIDPAGNEVVDRLSSFDIGEITVESSGTYRITVSGRSASTGTQIVRLSNG